MPWPCLWWSSNVCIYVRAISYKCYTHIYIKCRAIDQQMQMLPLTQREYSVAGLKTVLYILACICLVAVVDELLVCIKYYNAYGHVYNTPLIRSRSDRLHNLLLSTQQILNSCAFCHFPTAVLEGSQWSGMLHALAFSLLKLKCEYLPKNTYIYYVHIYT